MDKQTKPDCKKKGRTYSDAVKKRVIELFVDKKRTPKQIAEDLKTEFNGKTPKLKSCKRYIRAAGHEINGKW